ncbi:hypothetical protein [Paenibacillus glycanilyticus]|uniref:Uncharacterized protein n=1 Tax=Paenibacillus glycanilyticus TaxID=126569 RepID=A0ABQ6GB79_9BACL|nr:hypothetical protein [Paenibacillus glycanilyticus]GLX68204.1 hypothetical protein MU1_25490 [Paenibacillus glycanilyticus]
MQEHKKEDSAKSKLLTKDGLPLKVLSTSLGIALLANLAAVPIQAGAAGSSATATPTPTPTPTVSSTASGPKLVEWSSEAVKRYYDPAVDWNLPLPSDKELDEAGEAQESPAVTSVGGTGGGTTTVIQQSSGFGWDDLMLYHLLFNGGSSYSSQTWASSHRSYQYGSTRPYEPKTYSNGKFQNKPVVGSSVSPPKTSSSTGTVTRRSTSSSPGGIGGKSSGFSSSSSSSSGSHSSSVSSGGFGG